MYTHTADSQNGCTERSGMPRMPPLLRASRYPTKARAPKTMLVAVILEHPCRCLPYCIVGKAR